MRVERNKPRKFFWPKTLLKKWLNHKHNGDEFHFDEDFTESDTDDENVDSGLNRRHSCSGIESILPCTTFSGQPARHSLAVLMQRDSEFLRSKLIDKHQFGIFVGTWNVGGKTPHDKLDIEQWLGSREPADIYVLGLQEIVPLNAGNVLGTENNFPAVRWMHLIRDTLNKTTANNTRTSGYASNFPWQDIAEIADTFSVLDVDTGSSINKQNSFLDSDCYRMERQYTVPQEMLLINFLERSESENTTKSMFLDRRGESGGKQFPSAPFTSQSWSSKSLTYQSTPNHSQYVLTASKQMVGIFLSVWIRADLRRHVHDLKVSCVGCGLMGYFGNKGSISISMRLHQTTFCFVCSHLSSGERDGDEVRRNSDVSDILKRTQFVRTNDFTGVGLPETILEHDQIIWFGDLNYRLALSSRATRSLLVRKDWDKLLEKDQLHIEQRGGRVFVGWHEGKIFFAPTYKYRVNSDSYAIEKMKLGGKKRTPAWCDRILWYGEGLHQLSYVRAESKFSDHRPVYAVFSAEVDVLSRQKLKEILGLSKAKYVVEELLPSCDGNRRWRA